MSRRLLAPLLAVLLLLGGCSASADRDDEELPTAAEAALQEQLAAIDGVSESTVSARVGQVGVELSIDPARTDAAALAADVVAAFTASDFVRRALRVTIDAGDDRTFRVVGYDPAAHDRTAAALGIWWEQLGAGDLDGFVAYAWFGLTWGVDAQELIDGESYLARAATARATATAAGLMVLESDFGVGYPARGLVFEADPEALYYTPPSTEDLFDAVVKPSGIATYIAGIHMNLAEDDGDPNRHIIPVDVYIIPTELPQGGYPPYDAGVAQTALDALQVSSYRNAIDGGVRIDGIHLLTDTGLVRVSGAP